MKTQIDYFKYMEAQEQMCDDYCRFRAELTSAADLEAHCEICPMSNLLKQDHPLGYCPEQE